MYTSNKEKFGIPVIYQVARFYSDVENIAVVWFGSTRINVAAFWNVGTFPRGSKNLKEKFAVKMTEQ